MLLLPRIHVGKHLGVCHETSFLTDPLTRLCAGRMIHISSVIEWTGAMILMWQYAEVTGEIFTYLQT